MNGHLVASLMRLRHERGRAIKLSEVNRVDASQRDTGKRNRAFALDDSTRRRLREVGQGEKWGEKLTQRKCEIGERASGSSRGMKEDERERRRARWKKSIVL